MENVAPQTVASFNQRTTATNEDQSDGQETIETSDSPCDTSTTVTFSPDYAGVATRESASDHGQPQNETR